MKKRYALTKNGKLNLKFKKEADNQYRSEDGRWLITKYCRGLWEIWMIDDKGNQGDRAYSAKSSLNAAKEWCEWSYIAGYVEQPQAAC